MFARLGVNICLPQLNSLSHDAAHDDCNGVFSGNKVNKWSIDISAFKVLKYIVSVVRCCCCYKTSICAFSVLVENLNLYQQLHVGALFNLYQQTLPGFCDFFRGFETFWGSFPRDAYRVAQKNGATLSHCKYFENSMTELRGNWWTSTILYAEHSH